MIPKPSSSSSSRIPLKTIPENNQEKSYEKSEGQEKIYEKARTQDNTNEKRKTKASSDKFGYPEQDLENVRKTVPDTLVANIKESSSGRSQKLNESSIKEREFFQGPQLSSTSSTSSTSFTSTTPFKNKSSSGRSKKIIENKVEERRHFQEPQSASRIARPVRNESSSDRSKKLYETSRPVEHKEFQEPKSVASSSDRVSSPPQPRLVLRMLMDIFLKSSAPEIKIVNYVLTKYFPEEILTNFKELLHDFSFSLMGGNEIACIHKIVADASANPKSKALLTLIEKSKEINPNLHPLAEGPTLAAVHTLVQQLKPLLKLVTHRMDGCEAFLELKLQLESARDMPHKTIIEKYLEEPGNKGKVGPLYDFMYDFLNASFPLPPGKLHATVSEVMKISTEWASS